MKYKLLLPLAITLGLMSSHVQATAPSVNTKAHVGTYNLILQGDLNTNSDIEGRAFIGGSVNMSGSILEVGTHLPISPNVDAVTIVGDVDAQIVRTFNNNNIVYGGNPNSTIFEGGSATQVAQATLQSNFDAIWAQATYDSAFFKSLSKTGDVVLSQQGKKGTFQNDNTLALNVFNIDSTTFLTNQNGVFDLLTTPTAPIVINVSGAVDINLTAGPQGNFANFNAGKNVLWNFYDATSIDFNGGSWFGSVLAPKADINLGGGNLNGGLVAKSLDAQSELHNALYTYMPPTEPPSEVSAPASALIMALGLTFMGYRRFKNKV